MASQYPRMIAANSDSYLPPEFSDDAFKRWACRTALRMVNLPPGHHEQALYGAIVREGVPSPAWAQAFAFMMALSRDNKRKAVAA